MIRSHITKLSRTSMGIKEMRVRKKIKAKMMRTHSMIREPPPDLSKTITLITSTKRSKMIVRKRTSLCLASRSLQLRKMKDQFKAIILRMTTQ
jgi:hypothetical protein